MAGSGIVIGLEGWFDRCEPYCDPRLDRSLPCMWEAKQMVVDELLRREMRKKQAATPSEDTDGDRFPVVRLDRELKLLRLDSSGEQAACHEC